MISGTIIQDSKFSARFCGSEVQMRRLGSSKHRTGAYVLTADNDKISWANHASNMSTKGRDSSHANHNKRQISKHVALISELEV